MYNFEKQSFFISKLVRIEIKLRFNKTIVEIVKQKLFLKAGQD